MRRGWFEWKTTLYNWDCRRMDELSHNEVSSLGLPRDARAILVFPLSASFLPPPFFPLSSTSLRLYTRRLMDLSLSTRSIESWTNLCSSKDC